MHAAEKVTEKKPMKRPIITTVVVLVLSIYAVHAQDRPGIYSDQDGTLSALGAAAYSGTQTSSAIVKATIFWTFRGGHSLVQLQTIHPHFRLVCGQGNNLFMFCDSNFQPRELVIVQLDGKSNQRRASMATGNMFGVGHGGFDPKKVTTAVLTKRDDGNWEVTPDKDLKAGEYLITSGAQPQGFDFGIHQ
jgi:hypothetical protein